ncbi:hypothetical protein J9253_00455 [Thiothrix litoralis]|jgi:hypothetical protein|uniref:Uncharacterized protein n=1 Tax=Thiothrix litoralis TaxID=2891210 RepID=A0ABX7WTY8_9GAMM|nr:hypothetical protein [Thiothrix litoralis]QTR46472.1 hypothetical protein J9253_00455 [Thiothrix litoralis]
MTKNDNPVWAAQVIAAMQKTPAHSLHVPYRDAPLALSDGQRARLDSDYYLHDLVEHAKKDVKTISVTSINLSRRFSSVRAAGFFDFLTDDHAVILHSVPDASPAAAIANREELTIYAAHLLAVNADIELVSHVFVEVNPPYAMGIYEIKTRQLTQRLKDNWQRGFLDCLSAIENGGQNASYTNPTFDLTKI